MDRGTETGKSRGGTAIGRRTAVRGAGMAALTGGLALTATHAAAAGSQDADAWIVGAWRLSVAGNPRWPDVDILAVFLPGQVALTLPSPIERTALQTDHADAVEYNGAMAGQWLLTPAGDVRATLLQINYDRSGALVSVERMEWRASRLGDNTLTGDRSWREEALDGSLILDAQGTLRGERITVTP